MDPGDIAIGGPDGGPWQVGSPSPGLAGSSSADSSNLTGSPRWAIALQGRIIAPIPRGASAATVDSALEALYLIGPGNVSVAGPDGGPWEVEFTGALADADVQELVGDATNLTGDPKSVSVDEGAQASAPFEICTVAAQCRGGFAGTLGGELRAPAHLALNQATGHLYVTDENNRITEFDADGNFIRLWGANVVQPGGVGDNPTNEQKRIFFAYPAARDIPVGGTFKLRFEGQSTAPIAYNASTAAVESALGDLSNLAPADVSVTTAEGGPWTAEFSAPTPTPRSTSLSTHPASSPPSAVRETPTSRP